MVPLPEVFRDPPGTVEILDEVPVDFHRDSGDGFILELRAIFDEDVKILNEKKQEYGNSWKRRGGVGAFMMLARKWDRIENQLESAEHKYDIFELLISNPGINGIFDDIGDLRRYLALVEAEMRARGWRPKK